MRHVDSSAPDCTLQNTAAITGQRIFLLFYAPHSEHDTYVLSVVENINLYSHITGCNKAAIETISKYLTFDQYLSVAKAATAIFVEWQSNFALIPSIVVNAGYSGTCKGGADELKDAGGSTIIENNILLVLGVC